MHFRRSFQEPAAENDTARLAHGRWWEVRHTDGERIEADEEQEAVSPNLGRQRFRLRQLCLIRMLLRQGVRSFYAVRQREFGWKAILKNIIYTTKCAFF